VARIVLTQALICGAVGSILGLLAVVPSIGYAKSLIPWIYTPWWLLLVMVVPSLAMCFIGVYSFSSSALTVEPGGCSVPNHFLGVEGASVSFGKRGHKSARYEAFHNSSSVARFR